jgi:hypothetical protein
LSVLLISVLSLTIGRGEEMKRQWAFLRRRSFVLERRHLAKYGLILIMIWFPAFPADYVVAATPGQNKIGAAANTGNAVYCDVAMTGDPTPRDTIYIGGDYEFRFWIQNDVKWGGMNFTLKFWSDDGIAWRWLAQSEGYGKITSSATVVPGSRMYPPRQIFDLSGFQIEERDMDGVSPDFLCFGGVAMMAGLPVGPMEHMVSFHFRPISPWPLDVVGTMCLDTSWISPASTQNIYHDTLGGVHFPSCDCNHCWPVKLLLGNPNGDSKVDVGDAIFLLNYVFKGGRAPDPMLLGDANCDGIVNVGDAVYIINHVFGGGSPPCEP